MDRPDGRALARLGRAARAVELGLPALSPLDADGGLRESLQGFIDSIGVAPPIAGIEFDALPGDKAFDIDWIRAGMEESGASAVIPPKADRTRPIIAPPLTHKLRRPQMNVHRP